MKKIKIQITHWITGSVLFEYETENNTIKKTLEKAVAEGADLRGADLRGADLRGADLRDADGLDIWWHVHHETLYEQLTEPIRSRILYIKSDKPKDEIELRLKLLKPVLAEKGFPKDKKGWEKLHKLECKGCSWNGRSIFGDKK